MITSINGNLSFTSVVPVRVFVDGMETFNQKLIKSSCHQLNNVLKGPSNSGHKLSIIKKFAQHDPDYNLQMGYYGHDSIASDYFRCITKNNKSYIFTGAQAEVMKKTGKLIGLERKNCKEKNYATNFDLMFARKSYENNIINFLKNPNLRIKEFLNPNTLQKSGRPVHLNILMSSNKKYGLASFKTHLDDISFSV